MVNEFYLSIVNAINGTESLVVNRHCDCRNISFFEKLLLSVIACYGNIRNRPERSKYFPYLLFCDIFS